MGKPVLEPSIDVIPIDLNNQDEKDNIFFLIVLLISPGAFIQFSSKKKGDTPVHRVYLKAELTCHQFMHDRYYLIGLRERSIELEFSEELKEESVQGNITFQDQPGDLTLLLDLQVSRSKVMILFSPAFQLKEARHYEIVLRPGIYSQAVMTLPGEVVLECRTGLSHGETTSCTAVI